MSILQFAEYQMIKTIDTSETVEIGQFKPLKHGELKWTRLLIYKHGSIGGSESLTCHWHTSSELGTSYATSSAVLLSTVENSSNLNTSGDWFAWIRFVFNRENLSKNISYYLSLQASNYTRNGDTYYIGMPFDYPYPHHTVSLGRTYTDYPLAFQVFTYQEPVEL